MGLNLRVSSGSDAVEIQLTNAETEGIKTLQRTLAADADTVFGVDDFGKPREVSDEAFLDAVQNLLKAVETSGESEGRIYYLEEVDSNGQRGNTFVGMGCMINGVPYSLRVGRDSCIMREKIRTPNGPFTFGESVDIRSRGSIQTDHGKVFIRWKAVRDPLRSPLRNLAKFAEKHRGEMLTKILG
ncbi:MAG TPA: hypothetical protein VK797_26525 [Tepidisphaeraceae bacterium]|jgi:hypothetical protein|nr:hypothetical protein [Tepidisphaeraceae bacterium]